MNQPNGTVEKNECVYSSRGKSSKMPKSIMQQSEHIKMLKRDTFQKVLTTMHRFIEFPDVFSLKHGSYTTISHSRHSLTDTGITTTTIEEATANATSKIIIFAIPKGCLPF